MGWVDRWKETFELIRKKGDTDPSQYKLKNWLRVRRESGKEGRIGLSKISIPSEATDRQTDRQTDTRRRQLPQTPSSVSSI